MLYIILLGILALFVFALRFMQWVSRRSKQAEQAADLWPRGSMFDEDDDAIDLEEARCETLTNYQK